MSFVQEQILDLLLSLDWRDCTGEDGTDPEAAETRMALTKDQAVILSRYEASSRWKMAHVCLVAARMVNGKPIVKESPVGQDRLKQFWNQVSEKMDPSRK